MPRRPSLRAVRALLDQVAAEVAALPEPAVRALVPVLRQVTREVGMDLARALRGGLGETYTAQMHRRVLLQSRAALAHAESVLSHSVRGALQGSYEVAATKSLQHLARQWQVGSLAFGGTGEPLALPQAADLLVSPASPMRTASSSASRYAGQVGDDVRRQLAVGLVRGETVDQVARRLALLGGSAGLVALRGRKVARDAALAYVPEGLFRRYRGWAQRLVRTEVLAAYNRLADEAISEAAAGAPGLTRLWNAANDSRVCLRICRPLDRKVAPIGGTFPGGYDRPPAHPYCRCAVVAWHESWTT